MIDEMYLVFIISRPYLDRPDISESCFQYTESFPTQEDAVVFAESLGDMVNCVIIKGIVV